MCWRRSLTFSAAEFWKCHVLIRLEKEGEAEVILNKVSSVKGELFDILFFLGFVRKFGVGGSSADNDDSLGRTL